MPAALALIAEWFLVALRYSWAWIVRTAVRWMPSLVGQALAAIGLKFVVMGPGLNLIQSQVISRFDIVQGSALETLYYLNVDDFVSLIMAALLARQIGRISLRKGLSTGPGLPNS